MHETAFLQTGGRLPDNRTPTNAKKNSRPITAPAGKSIEWKSQFPEVPLWHNWTRYLNGPLVW
ncbi:MAG: hypothetical protein DMG49_04635, partial [Acidobacteria bacterium]